MGVARPEDVIAASVASREAGYEVPVETTPQQGGDAWPLGRGAEGKRCVHERLTANLTPNLGRYRAQPQPRTRVRKHSRNRTRTIRENAGAGGRAPVETATRPGRG